MNEVLQQGSLFASASEGVLLEFLLFFAIALVSFEGLEDIFPR